MVENVAVVDKFARIVEKSGPDDDLTESRDGCRVLPGVGINRLAIDLYHLEVVDVDVERVPILTGVAQPPLFGRAERDRLIDPLLVKLAAIDEYPKRR